MQFKAKIGMKVTDLHINFPLGFLREKIRMEGKEGGKKETRENLILWKINLTKNKAAM